MVAGRCCRCWKTSDFRGVAPGVVARAESGSRRGIAGNIGYDFDHGTAYDGGMRMFDSFGRAVIGWMVERAGSLCAKLEASRGIGPLGGLGILLIADSLCVVAGAVSQ